jgi:hypothetical protein
VGKTKESKVHGYWGSWVLLFWQLCEWLGDVYHTTTFQKCKSFHNLLNSFRPLDVNINFEKYDHNAKEVSSGPSKQDRELQFFYCIRNFMDALHHIFDILSPIQRFKHTRQF